MLPTLLKVNPLTLRKFYCFCFFGILIDAFNAIIILKILVEFYSNIQVLYKASLFIVQKLLLLAFELLKTIGLLLLVGLIQWLRSRYQLWHLRLHLIQICVLRNEWTAEPDLNCA